MTKMLTEIYEQPDIISKVLSASKDKIQGLVTELKQRDINNVVIAARGTSDHAGIYAKYLIEYSLGIPVSLAAPSILTVYSRKIDYSKSLVIGISQSGKALDALEVIKHAHSQNAVTIGITNFADSPIGNEAKYHLFTDAGLESSVAATKTFTAQMAVIALLAGIWADNTTILNALNKLPDGIRSILNREKQIEQTAQKYTYCEDCFILSRGLNYPIALEAALKLQETSYMHAQGYSISDFHHGPFAMIGDHTPVIVFAPEGPTFKDSVEMIDKLQKANAEIILVSNNKELLNRINISFEIPDIQDDTITPFFNVVFAQLFACKLALAKGRNPDSPRGLNKITITK